MMPESQPPDKTAATVARAAKRAAKRAAEESAALRANLHRRKQQSRNRDAEPPAPKDEPCR